MRQAESSCVAPIACSRSSSGLRTAQSGHRRARSRNTSTSSERTIYRDIADLIASKVPIEGAAGIGYSLRKGYDLPPLMFSESELEALVFGARMVQNWSDAELGRAADAALSKIENVLPAHLHRMLEDRSLWAPKDMRRVPVTFDLGDLRAAIRGCRKVRFRLLRREGRGDTAQGASLKSLVLSAVLDRRVLVRAARRLPLFPRSIA